MLVDPNGAAFGIVPLSSVEPPAAAVSAGSGDGADPVGSIAWLDLTVADAAATRDFYRQVVGWSVQDVAMKDAAGAYADFNMLGGDGEPAAGVCHARGVNADLPPVWMLYLPVGDLGESLQLVEEEGGEVIKATRGTDGRWAHAAVRDPVGVCLALVQG